MLYHGPRGANYTMMHDPEGGPCIIEGDHALYYDWSQGGPVMIIIIHGLGDIQLPKSIVISHYKTEKRTT